MNREYWLYFRIFKKLTQDGKLLNSVPLNKIKESLDECRILFNLPDLFDKAVQEYEPNSREYHLLNGRIDKVKKSDGNLAMLALEWGLLDMFLRISPHVKWTMQFYYKAVLGGSLYMVKMINEKFAPIKDTLIKALESNNTEICKIVLSHFDTVSMELLLHPISNNNMELVQLMMNKLSKSKKKRVHDVRLFHSAVLSGSIEMVEYISSKYDFSNLKPDYPSSKMGYKMKLIDDITYDHNGSKRFSHSMNYAIESGSLIMIEYINDLGYGITPSNFARAVKVGNIEIVKKLIELNPIKLPDHFWIHFDFYSPNQGALSALLVNQGLLKLTMPKHPCTETYYSIYKEDTTRSKYTIEALMDYETKLKIDSCEKLLYANLKRTSIIIGQKIEMMYEQLDTDISFLYDNVNNCPIKTPSESIIIELASHYLNKIIFLLYHKLIDKNKLLDFAKAIEYHELIRILQ